MASLAAARRYCTAKHNQPQRLAVNAMIATTIGKCFYHVATPALPVNVLHLDLLGGGRRVRLRRTRMNHLPAFRKPRGPKDLPPTDHQGAPTTDVRPSTHGPQGLTFARTPRDRNDSPLTAHREPERVTSDRTLLAQASQQCLSRPRHASVFSTRGRREWRTRCSPCTLLSTPMRWTAPTDNRGV